MYKSRIKSINANDVVSIAMYYLYLLSKKETSSLAGSEGSLTLAEPVMAFTFPSALKETSNVILGSIINISFKFHI